MKTLAFTIPDDASVWSHDEYDGRHVVTLARRNTRKGTHTITAFGKGIDADLDTACKLAATDLYSNVLDFLNPTPRVPIPTEITLEDLGL